MTVKNAPKDAFPSVGDGIDVLEDLFVIPPSYFTRFARVAAAKHHAKEHWPALPTPPVFSRVPAQLLGAIWILFGQITSGRRKFQKPSSRDAAGVDGLMRLELSKNDPQWGDLAALTLASALYSPALREVVSVGGLTVLELMFLDAKASSSPEPQGILLHHDRDGCAKRWVSMVLCLQPPVAGGATVFPDAGIAFSHVIPGAQITWFNRLSDGSINTLVEHQTTPIVGEVHKLVLVAFFSLQRTFHPL